jgi:hypothetical protein
LSIIDDNHEDEAIFVLINLSAIYLDMNNTKLAKNKLKMAMKTYEIIRGPSKELFMLKYRTMLNDKMLQLI